MSPLWSRGANKRGDAAPACEPAQTPGPVRPRDQSGVKRALVALSVVVALAAFAAPAAHAEAEALTQPTGYWGTGVWGDADPSGFWGDGFWGTASPDEAWGV